MSKSKGQAEMGEESRIHEESDIIRVLFSDPMPGTVVAEMLKKQRCGAHPLFGASDSPSLQVGATRQGDAIHGVLLS